MEDFADNVASLCIQKYKALGKKGKPTENEWTVLSGIVLENYNGLLSIVALATGTKCLGQTQVLNVNSHEMGYRLSDSHAEVLARRAFLRYLYDQIDLAYNGLKNDVFVIDDKGNISIINGISFHFFSSQTPCGDCSILPKENTDKDYVPPVKIMKFNSEGQYELDSNLTCNTQKNKIIHDVYRTGAKCVKTEENQDPHQCGVNYHIVGPLRTKPGRGDPTLSLSCSDKMAKWNVLGLQGSLLSLLIPQIKMKTIIIGGDCPFAIDAMQRGLYKRFNKNANGLNIVQASLSFTHKKGNKRIRACPSSIVWCNVRKCDTEIAVDGKKQGATKKKIYGNLLISRRSLFKEFLKICDTYRHSDFNIRHPKKITYLDCKQWSKHYWNTWSNLKSESFHRWPSKPLYLQKFAS